jgi:cation diffusion facilitator family transporter
MALPRGGRKQIGQQRMMQHDLETPHGHVFLGEGHERNERRTWVVIALCGAMMMVEIVGGLLFGSIALVADGLHMSTHAGALLLAALAYGYARRFANDARFTFGTGKLGDLAGFSSAIILAMIALLIAYEAVSRLFSPVSIDFREAIPIACLGLAVNVASAWLLSGSEHHHHTGHRHGHADNRDGEREIHTSHGRLLLSIFEENVPPRFRIRTVSGRLPDAAELTIETRRPDGARQVFSMVARDGYLDSLQEVPEPHGFAAQLQLVSDGSSYPIVFEEQQHPHGSTHRDNNMRAAVIHVMADAAVSTLVIVGLLLAQGFGWIWMDPVAGLIGALVIAGWSYGLIRDTGAILLDMNPDPQMTEHLREAIEREGDRLADLHVWRLGPGHLAAIVSVVTRGSRGVDYYRARLAHLRFLSHLTVEVRQASNGA